MNRLQPELHRLYLPPPVAGADPSPALIDAQGRVRALVMELAGPPRWEVLGKVWSGVQTELSLPAPAIAVSGSDGLQLWFSLEAPMPVQQAHRLLERLAAHFLPELEPGRLRLMPVPAESPQQSARHALLVPGRMATGEHWSAFVATDLAPVFAETPWLDVSPSEEGQAALLRGLASIGPAELAAAMQRLGPGAEPDPSKGSLALTTLALTATPPRTTAGGPAPDADTDDPRRFLLRVMNDETVPLALRIEAARALLPYTAPATLPND